MSRQSFIIAAATAFVVALGGAPALAADSGGNSGSSGAGLECREGMVPNATNQMCVPCPDGTVYDRETKECVARSSELIDDSDLYIHGEALAVSGHYEDALDALNAVADKDAMTLTMIGYSTRKLGRTEEGIAIYHQALAIDPGNLNTHEYLGEGYLAQGRVDLAEAQLDVLASLCGTDCEQYRDLRNAILGEPVWN
jgi:tetratricopeptide (TPR) repeat protein